MVVTFDSISFDEQPRLILKTAGGTHLGVIGCATEVHLTASYNELSVLEFNVPEFIDGNRTMYYDDIVGMRLIDIPEIGVFSLTTPSEIGEGATTYKHCSAYSLENEFTYKKITLPQTTYKFWDAQSPEDTVIGIILDTMPSWSIGYIPASIANKYRTFEVSNENCYSFLKNTAQKSYGCIIDFDTHERMINVRDIEAPVATQPVFLSLDNLARNIEVEENANEIVTRLDVNGADGLDIRDVNPTGTNKLINLDYFMDSNNFSQSIVGKYSAWKQDCENNERSYYVLSVEFAILTERGVAQKAKLADMKGELTSLENQQAVIISSIAQAISSQTDLDAINAKISAKKAEISAKESEISSIEEERQTILSDLKSINDLCRFEDRFTDEELIEIDKYIRDGDVSDPSFVATDVVSFTDNGSGEPITDDTEIKFAGGVVEVVVDANDKQVFTVRGGTLSAGSITANIVSAVCERLTNKRTTISAYMGAGIINGVEFPSGCVTFDGTADNAISITGSSAAVAMDGYRYFTLNATEYQKRAVSWDLYDYGKQLHERLSRPNYTFTITSANFLSLEDFTLFKNHLRLGDKVYIQTPSGEVLEPICIGVSFTLNKDIENIELKFGNSYSDSSAEFKLADLLDQSIQQSKDVAINHNAYVSFKNSGASTGLQEFMQSALDVAKNSIMSSNDQAISLDGAGLRLRKYSDESHTAFDDEQIWMSNNSIMLTRDGWNTAQMAIGKFKDPNVGQELWGIVAEAVYGTLLAGNQLIIESTKKSGDTAVFRMDGDGCRLYNSDFTVVKTSTDDSKTFVMSLNPEIGMVMGKLGVLTTDEETGKQVFHEDLASAWVDTDGNANFRGTIYASAGLIAGWNIAENMLYVGDEDSPTMYFGTNGIKIGDGFSVDVSTNDSGNILSAITLAGFGVSSENATASYTGSIIGAGATSEATSTTEIPYYVIQDDNGTDDSTLKLTFTFAGKYHTVATTSTDLPKVSGHKLSFTRDGSGVDIFAGSSGSAITPVGTGRLMGWDIVQGNNLVANTLTASNVMATNVYIGTDVAATQQWVLKTVGDALSINGSIGTAITDAVSKYNTYITGKLNLEAQKIDGLVQWKSGIEITPEQLNLYSSKVDGLETWKSSILLESGKIDINAVNINLSGYVTMDTFNAVSGDVRELKAGNFGTTALRASSGTFTSVTATSMETTLMTLGGSSIGVHTMTVGGTNVGSIVGTDAINFSIAGTQEYADGVSAAERAVTLIKGEPTASLNNDTKMYYVAIPYTLKREHNNDLTGTLTHIFNPTGAIDYGKSLVTLTKGTAAHTYAPDTKVYAVKIPYTLSNGTEGFLDDAFVATEAYESGKANVTLTKGDGATAPYSEGTGMYSVNIPYTLSNDKSGTLTYILNPTEAIDTGKQSVYCQKVEYLYETTQGVRVKVHLSNGKSNDYTASY